MFEKRSQPVLPGHVFLRRQLLFALIAFLIIGLALLLGVLGFHFWGGQLWIDSLVNAAMILSGMGLVGVIDSTSGKLFASFYAIFSGIVFLAAASVLMAPVVHRFLHRFHINSGK